MISFIFWIWANEFILVHEFFFVFFLSHSHFAIDKKEEKQEKMTPYTEFHFLWKGKEAKESGGVRAEFIWLLVEQVRSDWI